MGVSEDDNRCHRDNADTAARQLDHSRVAQGLPGRAPLHPAHWWAHLVGAPRVHPHKHELTILRKEIEDLRDVGGPVICVQAAIERWANPLADVRDETAYFPGVATVGDATFGNPEPIRQRSKNLGPSRQGSLK